MFESKAVRNGYGTKDEGETRTLCNEELHNLPSPNIIKVIKARRTS
jgi:hypothetical protein